MSNSRMRVTRLFFVETGTYNDMALRPYGTHLDPTVLSVFQEATRGGTVVLPSTMASAANSFIRPNTEAMGMVSIDQGWDSRRLRFMMEVEHSDFAGGVTVQYLTGYTDHVGISFGGHVDPNMRMYINSSIITNRVEMMTPSGRMMTQSVRDASHVLYGENTPGFGARSQSPQTMRPEDVFNTMGVSMMLHDLPGETYDVRPTFGGNRIKKSRRSNGSAPIYLSRLLESRTMAVEAAQSDAGINEVMASAAESVREAMVDQDIVLRQLSLQTNLAHGGHFTFAELGQVQPEVHHDDITKVVLAQGPVRDPSHQRGETEYWSGTNNETVAATILSHAVPALMADLMFTKVSFQASNQTIGGEFHVQVLGVQSFTANVDLSHYIRVFIHRVTTEIMRDLSRNNTMEVSVIGHFDMLGESRIEVGVGSPHLVPYVIPSFADGLMTPIMTNDHRNLQILATDIDNLCDNLGVANLSPQNTSYAPTALFQENHHHAPFGSV